MGAVQLPDELQQVIDQQVAEGRAATPMAFLEEAIMRLVDDGFAEEGALQHAVSAGLADIGAGHYTTVATEEDGTLLQQRLMAKLQSRLSEPG